MIILTQPLNGLLMQMTEAGNSFSLFGRCCLRLLQYELDGCRIAYRNCFSSLSGRRPFGHLAQYADSFCIQRGRHALFYFQVGDTSINLNYKSDSNKTLNISFLSVCRIFNVFSQIREKCFEVLSLAARLQA